MRYNEVIVLVINIYTNYIEVNYLRNYKAYCEIKNETFARSYRRPVPSTGTVRY